MPSLRNISWIVLFLLFQGCSIKEPPLKVYTLSADTGIKAHNSALKGETVKVIYPQSLKEKIGQEMNFSYSDSEQGSYQNAQWSNNIAQLLQGVFIETLQQSGLFKAVLSFASTAQEDLRLESTIFTFSHRVRGAASDAVVSIQFFLVDADSGKLVKSRRFSYAIPTVTTDAKGYTDATNKALRKLNRDLVSWLEG
ncbi:MAG: cholesterol transport system auxiliary component [Campylobacterota bacterium]|nr:cholesterol transport system auxiliary component [Campylobacterota bacterium]